VQHVPTGTSWQKPDMHCTPKEITSLHCTPTLLFFSTSLPEGARLGAADMARANEFLVSVNLPLAERSPIPFASPVGPSCVYADVCTRTCVFRRISSSVSMCVHACVQYMCVHVTHYVSIRAPAPPPQAGLAAVQSYDGLIGGQPAAFPGCGLPDPETLVGWPVCICCVSVHLCVLFPMPFVHTSMRQLFA